jgi:hypothetical protein
MTTDIFRDQFATENGITDDDVVDSEYQNAKERFTEIVKNRRNNASAELEQQIEDANRNYEYSTRQARNYLWELNDLKSSQKALGDIEEAKVENLQQEFDALLRHAKVEAVGIRGEEILVKTVPLTISNPDGYGSWPLGEFEIQIPTSSGRAGLINLINRTNAREADSGDVYHHPHIVNDNPCFGAIEEQLIVCLSRGEFSGALELLLQYLQTYNPEDSYGDNIRYWEEQ